MSNIRTFSVGYVWSSCHLKSFNNNYIAIGCYISTDVYIINVYEDSIAFKLTKHEEAVKSLCHLDNVG